MNRKQIIAAGVGAELFYQDGVGTYGITYRAIVESVEPKTTRRGAPNRGVEVTLWDEDPGRHWHGAGDGWRKDAETGKDYKRTIVDSTKLKGDWASWRTEQLAQRERDAERKRAKQAAGDRALSVVIAINEAISEELRAKIGEASRVSGHFDEYSVSMPPALARELLLGWKWAMSQNKGLAVAPISLDSVNYSGDQEATDA